MNHYTWLYIYTTSFFCRFGNAIHLFWRSVCHTSYPWLTLLMLFFYHAYRSYNVCLGASTWMFILQLYIVDSASFFSPFLSFLFSVASVQYQLVQLYILSAQTHAIGSAVYVIFNVCLLWAESADDGSTWLISWLISWVHILHGQK